MVYIWVRFFPNCNNINCILDCDLHTTYTSLIEKKNDTQFMSLALPGNTVPICLLQDLF